MNALPKKLIPLIVSTFLCTPFIQGQEDDLSDEIVTLSVFNVTSQSDRGYGTTHTLGATRVNSAIIDTPTPIITVNSEMIRDLKPQNNDEAIKYVAGTTGGHPPFFGNFSIRGTNTGTVYFDGLSIVQGGAYGLHDFANFERMEVIKGPNGTLYGSTSLGGLLNAVLKRPISAQTTEVELMYATDGPDGIVRLSVDHTGPASEDKKLLYRVIGVAQDGTRYNGGHNDRRNVTLALDYYATPETKLWTWLNWNNVNQMFGGQWRVDAGNNISTFLGNDFKFWENQDDVELLADEDRTYIEFGIEHAFDINESDWNLRLVSRYFDATKHQVATQVSGGLAFYDDQGNRLGTDREGFLFTDPRWTTINAISYNLNDRPEDYSTTGFYLDLVGDIEIGQTNHKLLTYAQYLDHSGHLTHFRWTHGPAGEVPYFPVGRPASILTDKRPFRDLEDDITFTNFGIQDNISAFDDRLIVVLGARYDSSTTDARNNISNTVTLDGFKVNEWTRKIGVVGRPFEDRNFTLFYSNSQTFNPVTQTDDQTGERFPNEQSEGDEFGIKFDLFDHRLVMTTSYFDYLTENLLKETPFFDENGEIFFSLAPVGTFSITGWEVDLAYQPIDNFSIMAGISDIESITASGVLERNIPDGFSFKTFAKYDFESGPLSNVSLGAGFEYLPRRPGDNGNSFFLPSQHSIDLMFAYQKEDWRFQINVVNVTDESNISGSASRAVIHAASPREARFTLSRRY